MSKKTTYNIKGMHCRSCELTMEQHLSKVPGVTEVLVSQKQGVAQVSYENSKPALEAIDRAVRNAGYSLGKDEKRHFFSREPMDYIELVFAAGALFVFYAVLKLTGVFSINLDIGSSPGLGAVFLIGLTAGVSTCMALIGGLVLGVSARFASMHPEATVMKKFHPHLFFNAGRLLSYSVLGGLIGAVGSAFQLSSPVLGALIVFLGLVMLLLGANLIGIFPRLGAGLVLPKAVSRTFGLTHESGNYSHRNAFLTGAATFFVPCGFTQAVQLYAVTTGSFTQGASIMFLFALGTLPGLLGAGGLSSFLRGQPARYFFKFAGLVVIILALLNMSFGFNLTGIVLAGNDGEDLKGVKVVDGKQVVQITQSGSGYSPNKITVKKDMPVKLMINATNLYTCTANIVIPKFRISTVFKAGINEIEFTPTEAGPVKFSCSMGMFTGVINVIN